MPSTYSTNLKIELMATGENSGTWGTVTNTNLGTAVEQAIVGYGNPDFTTDANLTITLSDSNSLQAARALVLNVTSTPSLSATRELIVPTIQKQYIVQNNTTGSQSITVKTSAGTGITVPNGRKAHLYVDGTNVIQMFDFVDINGGAIDGTTVGAASASTGAFTTLTASGATTLNGAVALGDAAADLITVPGTINSNVIFTDNTYDIGASGATRPRTIYAATSIFAPLMDATNLEVTNIKANDGTAAASIANSTGAITVSTLLNVDNLRLDGNTISSTDTNGNIIIAPNGTGQVQISNAALDLTTIEVTNIKAKDGTASMTLADTTGIITLSATAGTANGVLYLNGSRAVTSGSALTFDGTKLGVGVASAQAGVDIENSGSWSSGNIYNYPAGNAFVKIQGVAAQNNWIGIAGSYGQTTGSANLLLQANFNNTTQQAGHYIGSEAQSATSSDLTFGSITGGVTTGTNATKNELMRLTSTGLGIGTTSPQRRIHGYIATGPVARMQTNGSNAAIEYVPGATDGTGSIYNWVVGAQYNVGNAFEITPSTAAGGLTFSTPALVVTSAGNVGIGTNSPASSNGNVGRVLQAAASGNTSSSFAASTAGTNIDNAGIFEARATAQTSGADRIGQIYIGRENTSTTALSGYIAFGTSSGGTFANRMRLDSSGNLGIGVTNPGSRLQVETNGTYVVTLNNTVDDARIELQRAGTQFGQLSAGNNFFNIVASGASTAIRFLTNSGSTQAMTLDENGKLLLGVTSSTGLSNSDFAMVNGGSIRFRNAANSAYLNMINVDSSNNLNFGVGGVPAAITFGISGIGETARITSGGYFKASNDGTYLDSTGPYHEIRQTTTGNNTLQVSNNTADPYGVVIAYTGASPNGTGNYFLYCRDSGPTLRAEIRSNGGLANYQANDANLSDQRVKKDIVAAPSYWDKIKGIEIVHFKYKDQTHDDNNVGVIAQQVEQVAPEFVDQDGWGETPEDGVPLKSIYTSDMYHAAIKALQEAMARIEKLEAEVAALKGA